MRIIGQGVNNATNRVSRAVACVSVGLYPCVVIAGISGYANGKEKTRDKIRLEKLADKNTKKIVLVFGIGFERYNKKRFKRYWKTFNYSWFSRLYP